MCIPVPNRVSEVWLYTCIIPDHFQNYVVPYHPLVLGRQGLYVRLSRQDFVYRSNPILSTVYASFFTSLQNFYLWDPTDKLSTNHNL